MVCMKKGKETGALATRRLDIVIRVVLGLVAVVAVAIILTVAGVF